MSETAPNESRAIPLRFGELNELATGVRELCLWSIGWSTMWAVRAFRNGSHDARATLDYG
jgi:hypothetical protein